MAFLSLRKRRQRDPMAICNNLIGGYKEEMPQRREEHWVTDFHILEVYLKEDCTSVFLFLTSIHCRHRESTH